MQRTPETPVLSAVVLMKIKLYRERHEALEDTPAY